MKIKRFIIFAVVIAMVSALVFPIWASAETTLYSATLNSGVRDEVCVSISGTGIEEYYTGASSIEALTSMSSDELLSALRTLMTETHDRITTYSNCRDLADETACENENGKIVMLYTSHTASFSDYNNGSGWNREHVWPKSLGGFDDERAGADLHHIRPTENRTNANRGNKKYGNVASGSSSMGNLSNTLGGTYNSQYFEPNDNVKGDVARICLYVFVRWGDEYQKCSNVLNVFESVDTLLAWCEADPVDTWEMGRNEVVEEIQGNRNVFIDYPELAWILFDKSIPENMTTPSGLAKESSKPDPEPEPCTHKSTTVKDAKAATCRVEGYSGDTYCVNCDILVSKGSSLPITTHTYGEGKVVEEPTESSVGYRKFVCTVCGYPTLEEIPQLESDKTFVYIGIGAAAFVVIAGGVTFVVIKKRKHI